MAMETDEFSRLFQKFIDKTITVREQELFFSYIDNPENDDKLLNNLAVLCGYVDLKGFNLSIGSNDKGVGQIIKAVRSSGEPFKGDTKWVDEILARIEARGSGRDNKNE